MGQVLQYRQKPLWLVGLALIQDGCCLDGEVFAVQYNPVGVILDINLNPDWAAESECGQVGVYEHVVVDGYHVVWQSEFAPRKGKAIQSYMGFLSHGVLGFYGKAGLNDESQQKS